MSLAHPLGFALRLPEPSSRVAIVSSATLAGNWPYPGGNVYGATKAFVRQFSLNLRADLTGTAIRVTDIEPGLCGGTEFSHVRFHGDDAKANKVYQDVQPLTAEDIADTMYWIATRPPNSEMFMSPNRICTLGVAY